MTMKRTIMAAAVLAAGLCVTAPARAAMVDFSAVLTDMDGQPIKDGDKVMTLGRASMIALLTAQPDDGTATVEDKYKRGKLAERVYQQLPLDLDDADISMIRKFLGKTYPPLILLRATPMLDTAKPAPK